MTRKLFISLVALILVALALPAMAITSPTEDGGEHPQVGQLLFYVPDAIDPRFSDAGSWFNCTGTLLDGTTVLTAGHCTFAVGSDGVSTTIDGDPRADTTGDGIADNGTGGNDVWITFQDTVDYSILPPSSDYAPDDNQGRYEAWRDALNASVLWTRGESNPHPGYNDAAFFLHDAGVVELEASIALPVGFEYGELPDVGHLDQYSAKRRNSQRFTPVGYGLQFGFPFYPGDDTRYQASVMLVDAYGVAGIGSIGPGIAVMFSNNGGKAHKGGTCFGDSGGPVFDEGTTIVAVTSFGLNPTCTGVGGGYRIDQEDDLAFINSHL